MYQIPHSDYHQQYEVSKISIYRAKKKKEREREQ
jgi:hypothetical protein